MTLDVNALAPKLAAPPPPSDGPPLPHQPYGMAFDEITASSLVKIGVDGRKLDDNPWPVNPPGFVIHS